MFGEIFIQSLNYYSKDTTRTEAIPTCVLYQKIVEAEDRGLQRVQQHWVPAWVVNQQHHLATISQLFDYSIRVGGLVNPRPEDRLLLRSEPVLERVGTGEAGCGCIR